MSVWCKVRPMCTFKNDFKQNKVFLDNIYKLRKLIQPGFRFILDTVECIIPTSRCQEKARLIRVNYYRES